MIPEVSLTSPNPSHGTRWEMFGGESGGGGEDLLRLPQVSEWGICYQHNPSPWDPGHFLIWTSPSQPKSTPLPPPQSSQFSGHTTWSFVYSLICPNHCLYSALRWAAWIWLRAPSPPVRRVLYEKFPFRRGRQRVPARTVHAPSPEGACLPTSSAPFQNPNARLPAAGSTSGARRGPGRSPPGARGPSGAGLGGPSRRQRRAGGLQSALAGRRGQGEFLGFLPPSPLPQPHASRPCPHFSPPKV